MNSRDEFDGEVIKRIKVLHEVPERNMHSSAESKAKFLQEARESALKLSPVTPSDELRPKGWIQIIQSLFLRRRKEHSPMFGTLATIMVIASLILGTGGVTLVSAQAAQPDEPLYGVKVWSEDTRLSLTSDPMQGYQLALEFMDRRAEEIQTMLAAGGIPPESVEIRYQNQVESAIRLALNLPEDQAIQAMQEIQSRIMEQDRAMEQVNANGSDTGLLFLQQTRTMLQERLQWVQNALTDPAQVREEMQERTQEQQQTQQQDQNQVQNRQQNGQTDTEKSSSDTQAAPGSGDGNPWTTGTPTPGSSYGPGPGAGSGESNPWTTGTPTPYSSYGPGPGTGSDEGNPWTTGTPTPGSAYGPGPGSGTCTATCQGPQATGQGAGH